MMETTGIDGGFPRKRLVCAAVGVVAMTAGLALDSMLHARNPGLATHEGVFALGNPGHVLLGAGMALAAVGTIGALTTVFRLGARVAAVAVIVLAGTAAAARPGEPASHVDGHSEEASTFLTDVRAAIAPFADENVALEAGYRPNPNATGPNAHYPNRAFHNDGVHADPERPEGLVYRTNPDGTKTLLGAVFNTPRWVTPPVIEGAMWHTHSGMCDMHDQDCPAPHMLHVWTASGVRDPFADNFRLAMLGG